MALAKPGVKKSDVDPVFQDQLTEHQQQAKKEYEKRRTQSQYTWTMPQKKDWSGDPFDWEGMKSTFSRAKANADFVKACEDGKNPGVSGDLVITTTQIDYLSVMERSFRARMTSSWPRMYAHYLGRRRGHGDAKLGLFLWGILQYIRGLVKQCSSSEDSAPSE